MELKSGEMIPMMCSKSHICMATIVFYTCILVPLHQLKQSLLSFLNTLLYGQSSYVSSSSSSSIVLPCLPPAARFEDLQKMSHSDMCSICLVDFRSEDLVTQLSSCKHVFHLDCIDKWLHCHQFTCPLCRSSFLFHWISSCFKWVFLFSLSFLFSR